MSAVDPAVPLIEPPQRSFWRQNQRRIAPWLFLAPGMAMFLVYVIIPIFQSMWISLYDWDGLGAKTADAKKEVWADLRAVLDKLGKKPPGRGG